jgi:hypothetical protein
MSIQILRSIYKYIYFKYLYIRTYIDTYVYIYIYIRIYIHTLTYILIYIGLFQATTKAPSPTTLKQRISGTNLDNNLNVDTNFIRGQSSLDDNIGYPDIRSPGYQDDKSPLNKTLPKRKSSISSINSGGPTPRRSSTSKTQTPPDYFSSESIHDRLRVYAREGGVPLDILDRYNEHTRSKNNGGLVTQPSISMIPPVDNYDNQLVASSGDALKMNHS